jgi:hypothetical protein
MTETIFQQQDPINTAILKILAEFYPQSVSYPHFDRLIRAAVEHIDKSDKTIGTRIADMQSQHLIDPDHLKITKGGLQYLKENS